MTELTGLSVKLGSRCWCGSDTAHVVSNGALICDGCGIQRSRLDEKTQRFITEFIRLAGRPTSPIRISEPLLRAS